MKALPKERAASTNRLVEIGAEWPAIWTINALTRQAALSLVGKTLLGESVQPVKRRGLIAFRQGGIIEDRILKIRHFAFQQENRLPDV